jgi:ADP-ribose pyrophosphatase YjhB (NUDIX family)
MNEEELVDLVDARGTPRVRGVTRLEVSKRKAEFAAAGLYQPIVVVVVIDGDNVIGQVRGRSKGDDGSGQIDHVCGVVAAGETWRVAAKREAVEEIGVGLEGLRFVLQGVNVNQRFRTLAVATPLGRARAVSEDEVEGLVVATPTALQAMMRTRATFVPGFFEDLHRALMASRGAV